MVLAEKVKNQVVLTMSVRTNKTEMRTITMVIISLE